jgi:hypothetical protein
MKETENQAKSLGSVLKLDQMGIVMKELEKMMKNSATAWLLTLMGLDMKASL